MLLNDIYVQDTLVRAVGYTYRHKLQILISAVTIR